MKKNILILTIPDSESGVSDHTNSLTSLLDKKTNYNPIIMKHWKSQVDKDNKRAGYTLYNSYNQEIDFDFKIDNLLKRMGNEMLSPEIIHLHTTTYESDKELSKITNKFKKPLLYTAHAILKYLGADDKTKAAILNGEEFNIEKGPHSNQEAQERIIQQADKITLIAESSKEVFSRLYPKQAHKAVTMLNFTNFYKFFEKNEEEIKDKSKKIKSHFSNNGGKLLSYCGRIEGQKSATRLVSCWETIADKYPETRLLLIGARMKKYTEKEVIDGLIEEHGLSPKYKESIYATPWVLNNIDLASHLKACDALMQPILAQNIYGIVSLEAASVGLPLINCEGELSFGNSLTNENALKAFEGLDDHKKVQEHLKRVRGILDKKYSEDAFLKNISKIYSELLSPVLTI